MMPIDDALLQKIREGMDAQPFGKSLGLRILELSEGYAKVEMPPSSANANIFHSCHGGAIFALLDQAFGAAANSRGTVFVALSVTINYLRAADPADVLYAEAKEISRSRRISTYNLEARNSKGELIATALATAYGKGDQLTIP
jgi:acyl-CoA thioesterase